MSINRGIDKLVKMYMLMVEYYKAYKKELALSIFLNLSSLSLFFSLPIYLHTWIETQK